MDDENGFVVTLNEMQVRVLEGVITHWENTNDEYDWSNEKFEFVDKFKKDLIGFQIFGEHAKDTGIVDSDSTDDEIISYILSIERKTGTDCGNCTWYKWYKRGDTLKKILPGQNWEQRRLSIWERIHPGYSSPGLDYVKEKSKQESHLD